MKLIKELSFLIILSFLLSSGTWEKMPGIDGKTPYAGLPGMPAEVPANTKTFAKKLHFEPNLGQTDAAVHFLSRGNGYTLFLASGEAVVSLQNAKTNKQSQESYAVVRMQLEGANPSPLVNGREKLTSITNYYIGNNPDDWHSNIANYARVKYRDVYPGIDLVYYGNEGRLEYDFIVSPDGNPKDILLKFFSDERIRIDEQGNLVCSGRNNTLILKQPVAYQDKSEGRDWINAKFALVGDNQVKFEVSDYDSKFPLIIDPVLIYSTYLGGSDNDLGKAIAADAAGCAYVTGSTQSADFPTYNSCQSNIFPGQISHSTDVFVTKFNAEGTDIIYSTYIGGRGNESGDAIAVDANGQVCITGRTSSGDNSGTPEYEGFPLKNACQTETSDNSDAFVTVLNSSGELAYSTYLGGKYEDYGTDITVDDYGIVYVTGTVFSFDFPIKNAFMEHIPSYYYATFVTKIDPTKSGDESLVYSTFLGGEYDDYSCSIAVDKYGCAYVTGEATTGFPTTANAIQPEYQGKGDVYVTKLSSDGSSLIYSTFLGDSLSNSSRDIVVDDSCCAYVCGLGLPATPGALNNPGSSFLCKLNSSGDEIIYTARVYIDNLAVDKNGNIFGAYTNVVKGNMVFGVNQNGSDTLFKYNINIGPSDLALDADSNIYIVGSTDIDSLLAENAYQSRLAGNRDAFVTKIHIEPPEMLVVKMLSDPLHDIPKPVTNTLCDIFSIDLSKSKSLVFLESVTTDGKGLLHLPVDRYQPGMAILIRTNPEKKPSIKNYRTEKTKYAYKVYVDNLIIDSKGNVGAQHLETDPADTTLAYLGHTSIGFSLVASAEWLASEDYILGLANAFIYLNNILFDVTNGQAFIDTLAVFDDASHFKDADIKIFANNNQWPCATVNGVKMKNDFAGVKLPPVWVGTQNSSIEAIYNTDPVDPSVLNYATTIVHELGHYIFGFWDEYRNKKGKHICENINFGFMDNQYNLDDPRSTEMSDYEESDTTFKHYQLTHQFEANSTNCWEFFQSTYTKVYDNVTAHILRPRDLGILADDVIKGPNSNYLDPDFSVGSMMGFDFKVTTTTNPRLDVLITKSATGGLPVPGARTILQKKGAVRRSIDHGLTNEAGRIKLFNAEPGDVIYAEHDSLFLWSYQKVVVAPPKKNSENADVVIELKTISGQFSLLADLSFDATGIPVYRCLADPLFSSPPQIQVYDDVSISEKQILSESGGVYSTVLNKSDFKEGQVFFSAPDINAEEFFVFQDASISDLSE